MWRGGERCARGGRFRFVRATVRTLDGACRCGRQRRGAAGDVGNVSSDKVFALADGHDSPSFQAWKLETERDIFRKMKTRKRFQTHRSSTKSDRSKFSGGSDFFKVLPAAWTNSRPNPRMNDRIERRLGLEHTRTRHDEDRGGSVDDQEAARGHAHPHQGASSDDRDRDREIPELIDFDLFDRPPGQCPDVMHVLTSFHPHQRVRTGSRPQG